MIALFSLLVLLPVQSEAATDAVSFIKRELLNGLPWDKGSVEIDEVETPGLDPAQYDSLRLDLPRRITSPGRISFSLELRSKGREAKTIWGRARVRVFTEAVVALKALKGRTKIAASDLNVARVELEEARDAFSTIEDAVGQVVLRPIAAGSVLQKDYVRPEVIVKRGERVAIRVESGNIMIRSAGVASEDGYRGGTVAVKTASGKEVLGTVAGPGEIIINF